MQPTEENPYIVDNYPYGFKKTFCRFWVESVKNKGDRWVMQTQNPKTKVWNKPKKSTYCAVIVAYVEDGKVTYKGAYRSTSAEDYEEFVKFIGSEDMLNDLQKTELKLIRAYIRAYSGVTFEVRTASANEEEEKAHEEEQNKVQETINNRVKHEYINDNGVLDR